MNDMRMSNYEWYENIKLWMIWEYKIMSDMRMQNYEWYENAKLWVIWEYQIMSEKMKMKIVKMNKYENNENIKYEKNNEWYVKT